MTISIELDVTDKQADDIAEEVVRHLIGEGYTVTGYWVDK